MSTDAAQPTNTNPTIRNEVDALKAHVDQLEGRVDALESALRLMGWVTRPTPMPALPAAPPVQPAPPPPAPPPPAPPAYQPLPRAYVPPPPSAPAFDFAEWLTSIGPARILALVGGGALLLGMAYFLSLAFSRGWIGPEMRVALGLVAGFGLLPAGGLLFDRARPTLGHVVVAVGLGTIELALFAARLYGLASAELAMIGALVGTIGAGIIAVRWNSQLVAGMGIAAVLAAPPIVGAPANLVTVSFLSVVLVGSAVVSLRRAWHWLPWLSFVLTAPQVLVWLAGGDVPATIVLTVLGAYWSLFVVSAVVPVLIDPRRPLASPMALLGTVAAFCTLSAYWGFSGEDAWLRGAFTLALSAANLATGIGLVRRRGLHDDLSQSALGLAAALYIVAFALLLEGPGVPIAWSVVMLACAWVWTRFKLERAAIAAGVIGSFVALHLVVIEYAFHRGIFVVSSRPNQLIPYLDGSGMALAVFLAALAAIGWFSRNATLQQVLAALALGLVAVTVPFEASDVPVAFGAPMTLLGWTLLAVIALSADRLWNKSWGLPAQLQPLVVAGIAVGVCALGVLSFHFGLANFFRPSANVGFPFDDEQSLMSLLVIVGLWLVALSRNHPTERVATICISLVVVAALLLQQLPLEFAVVGWCAIAIGLLTQADQRRGGIVSAVTAGGLLISSALGAYALAPLSRLTIAGWSPIVGGPPNAATIALLALAAALAVAAARETQTLRTRRLTVAVLVAVVYMLSIGLVDSFAVRAGPLNQAAFEEVGRQAQVALTILWASLGLGLLGIGLARDNFAGRAMGMSLLGVATAKVFVYDLAALDVAYRVLSLIGVGVLLLAGAYGYQRLRARSVPAEPAPDKQPA